MHTISSYIHPSLGAYSTIWMIIRTYLSFVLLAWVIRSYARYKILKLYKYEMPWMAWIPILSVYALARVAVEKQSEIRVLGIAVPSDVFVLFPILSSCISCVPIVGSIISFVAKLFCKGRVYQQIFARCEDKPVDDCEAIGILASFFGIIATVKFLLYKPENIDLSKYY